jgi:hypothetical protein
MNKTIEIGNKESYEWVAHRIQHKEVPCEVLASVRHRKYTIPTEIKAHEKVRFRNYAEEIRDQVLHKLLSEHFYLITDITCEVTENAFDASTQIKVLVKGISNEHAKPFFN